MSQRARTTPYIFRRLPFWKNSNKMYCIRVIWETYSQSKNIVLVAPRLVRALEVELGSEKAFERCAGVQVSFNIESSPSWRRRSCSHCFPAKMKIPRGFLFPPSSLFSRTKYQRRKQRTATTLREWLRGTRRTRWREQKGSIWREKKDAVWKCRNNSE